MRRFLGLIVVLAILLGVLWLALERGAPAPAQEAAQSESAAKTEAAPPAALESPPTAADPGRVEAPSAQERAPVAAPALAEPGVQLAELRGRFMLEGGAPAVGAKVLVHGWESNNERVMKYGRPKEDWKELRAECDADGRFSLRFDPPRAYQFVLDCSLPGCAEASWRWGELEPGKLKDLGEVTLPRGGTIIGRVLDGQGNPTQDNWMVYADGGTVARGDGADATRAHAQADRSSGAFRLESLPPGHVELKAHSEIANWIDGPTVEVRAGETVEANIQYAGPDNSRRITVVTFARPFYTFDDDVGEIVLSAPGMEPRKAKKIAQSSQSFSFDDLEPGSYSITIDDPKFRPWRKDGVQPGQRVDARLTGAASVSLAVVDAASRAPVEHYTLRVRFVNVNFSPNQFEVFNANRNPPTGGLIEGLIPHEQTLSVIAEGYAPCELHIESLEPGEVRALTAELRRGATVVVRVLESDGKTPRAGISVTLGPSAPPGQENDIWTRSAAGPSQREATSDADGRASFGAIAAGTYALHAELTPLLATDLDALAIAVTDTEKVVDVCLPASGSLVGRVLGFEKAPVAGCTLLVLPLNLDPEQLDELEFLLDVSKRPAPNSVAVDGTFRTGPLRVGKSRVSLQYPETRVHDGANRSWGQPGTRIELGEVEIPAGRELQKDFELVGKLPGRIEVEMRVNGTPATDARVDISSTDQAQSGGVIELDANGRGVSGPIAPGPVKFVVTGPRGRWSWSPPGSWTVASEGTLRVSWDAPLVDGSLQLVDAVSGVGLAKKLVLVRPDTPESGHAVQGETDAQGKLELRLLPAAYHIDFTIDFGEDGKPGRSPYERARFEWTGGGPANAVLKVSKKP